MAALLGLFLIVPLSTWADTGRFRAALEAAKGYGLYWLAIGVCVALGHVLYWLADMVGLTS